MKAPPSFDQVQRIVLQGSLWAEARHLVLSLPERGAVRFLNLLLETTPPTAASRVEQPRELQLQVSLGLSRRGLERLHLPDHLLSLLALKSPAFTAGAALRASSQLGASGSSAPSTWADAFHFMTVDAVLSLHARSEGGADAMVKAARDLAKDRHVQIRELPLSRRLPRPAKVESDDQAAQWVHFGFRDGLARIGIEHWTSPQKWAECSELSRFPAGEFLLGHAQKSGANPWLSSTGRSVWPKEVREFFRDGSFGVLQQLEQNVADFEKFVHDKSKIVGLEPAELKAKLCGRTPQGVPLADPTAKPTDDFDFELDRQGYGCPFGSHIRRMNPRGDALAHAGRVRPLLRRGMPYGSAWTGDDADDEPRGLMGHFFCASIEEQFEHLLGQWAERVPMGSLDRGQARDPLIGQHERGDGEFEIPQSGARPPLTVKDFRAFTRTRGLAYLFYPSLSSLRGLADSRLWRPADEDNES